MQIFNATPQADVPAQVIVMDAEIGISGNAEGAAELSPHEVELQRIRTGLLLSYEEQIARTGQHTGCVAASAEQWEFLFRSWDRAGYVPCSFHIRAGRHGVIRVFPPE